MVINQWVPAAHRGDAVGDSARLVRDLLRKRGFTSDLFALSVDDDLTSEVIPFGVPETHQGDITILHFAVPSPMTAALTKVPGRRVIQYHNITPAHFFSSYDSDIFRIAVIGRQELNTLVGRVDLALGDSEFNKTELDSIGFAHTGVMPIAVNLDRISPSRTHPVIDTMLADGPANILFVGRIAPNKKIEDHIRLAEHCKRYIDTDFRFICVGRTGVVPKYYSMLRALIEKYGIPKERFLFPGIVSDAELASYYRQSDVYVSLSEHEGFCVPLLEAMSADLPVLAYGAGAVSETLGGAGVCFKPKDLEYAAEMLRILVYDNKTRMKIISDQRRRLAHFSIDRVEAAIDQMLDAVA